MGVHLFNTEELKSQIRSGATGYLEADPFPHTVITDFLRPDQVCALAAEFPPDVSSYERHALHSQSNKYAMRDWGAFGPRTREFIAEMHSEPVLSVLSEMTGLHDLLPDPYFEGGGQHFSGPGGRLGVHADFNVHPRLAILRVINVLVYLNETWKEEWGGNLELWNEDMTELRKSVVPLGGTAVIFSCSETSFHGLPDPITCPEGTGRKSIALYYYQVKHQLPTSHSTLYKDRPDGDSHPKSVHGTAESRVGRLLRKASFRKDAN